MLRWLKLIFQDVFIFKILVAAVEYVTLHDSIFSNCDHAVSFTCVTGLSRPASDIWWHTAGMSMQSSVATVSTSCISYSKAGRIYFYPVVSFEDSYSPILQ